MALTTVKKPLFTKNNVNYDLQYDPVTGAANIISTDGSTNTLVYKDGDWTSASSLVLNSAEQQQYHQQAVLAIQSAYTASGGSTKGYVLPQWANQNYSNNQPGQKSSQPQQNQPSTTTNNSGGGVGQLFTFLADPKSSYEKLAVNGGRFGVGNEKELFGGGMVYPNDLMSSQQDYFAISQFTYKPSKGDDIFGGNDAVKRILLNGLQPGSNLQSPIGTVFLPMPNSVADSNNISWGEDAMGNLAAAATANTMANLGSRAALAAFGSLLGQGGTALQIANLVKLASSGAIGDEMATLLGGDITSKLLKLQGFGVEAESILARGAGIVPNSNLELLFNSPTLRKFSFNYRLSPRSDTEAKTVRRIIRFFKQGMAAKKIKGKSGQSSFFLGTPNVFKLEYKSGRTGIDGVNKFKTCALTSFNCNYTPDGFWSAYDKGQPVSTVFQMSFDELEPIYDTDYQADNIFEGRDDLSSVSNNAVGY